MSFIFLTFLIINIFDFRYYTVLAPRVLRPNSEYHVAVSTQMVSQPITIIVGVVGTDFDGGEVDISQSVTVEPYSTHTVKLEVSKIKSEIFHLKML